VLGRVSGLSVSMASMTVGSAVRVFCWAVPGRFCGNGGADGLVEGLFLAVAPAQLRRRGRRDELPRRHGQRVVN